MSRIRCSRKKITPGLHLTPGPSHPTPWPQHHSQLLVVLVCKVAEPGRVEEELGRVLQQEQDEAQAAQAAETQASLTVPVKHPSPWGPASARDSALLLPVCPHAEPGLSPALSGPAAPPAPPVDLADFTAPVTLHSSPGLQKRCSRRVAELCACRNTAGAGGRESHCPICHPSLHG